MVIVPPVSIPLSPSLALRTISFQFTRDGEQTSNLKVALMMTLDLQLQAVFIGSEVASNLFLASAVDAGWYFLVIDDAAPRRAVGRFIQVSDDVTLAIDINDGSGGGNVGAPATIEARVRVAGLDAQRTVVGVEQQIDGVWRVAGSGQTGVDGEALLELQVTPSSLLYAVAVDDWGRPFQADLGVTVGMVIRPSVFAGWLYQVTEAGTLPSAEPEWWPAEGENPSRLLGTARAIAVRYYQPVGHGPLLAELS